MYPKIGESACSASSAPHPCRAPSHPAQVSPTSERPLPHASSTSSSQRRPQNLRAQLPAPAEPQQPSQTVPCASHAKSSRPNPSHPQATEKVLHVYTTHMHQPSQTAEQPRQACHCCARAVLAHPTSHATAVPELRPRVRIRCFSRFANGHAARRPDARRDRWSRTHGRTLSSTNHHRQMASPCKATPAEPSCKPCNRHRRRPPPLSPLPPRPAERQQPSQTVPCASHAKSSHPNPSHPHKPRKMFYTCTRHYMPPAEPNC